MSEYADDETDASQPHKGSKKAQELTGSSEGGTDAKPGDSAGEDEGSAPVDGADQHLKEDQTPTSK